MRTLRRPSWKDSFPPKELVLAGDNAKVAEWLAANVPTMLPADPTTTERERQLARLSAGEYISLRKAGQVACEEYAAALTKRWTYYSCAPPHVVALSADVVIVLTQTPLPDECRLEYAHAHG